MSKILIIEDRRENIVFIANNILKPKGFNVITARNGQIGLQKAEEEVPDLIITDIKLPKMSGLDVMEKLLEKGLLIPTIVMTFHGTEETAVRALRLGARDYLIKPFTIEDMEAALERVFRPLPTSPEAYRQKLEAEVKINSLAEELEKMRTQLDKKDQQLKILKRDSSNHSSKAELDELTKQAEAWEQDNARLNQLLAETKQALSQADSRAKALEEAVVAQKSHMEKYQKESRRLANELRNLSEAMRLMSQDVAQQTERLAVLLPHEEET